MADKQQAGYIEQLKEMRALRTQQLRQQGADKAFYSSMTASQRMLIKSNEKMISSMENMSRSMLSGFKGLAVSIGGIAGKGVQASASGAAGLAGSIAGGLTKVLPLAIGGLLAKVLLWDNLTEDSKNKLTSSVANLFQSVFGGVPEYLANLINSIKDKLKGITVTSPLFDELSKKAGAFVKMMIAGFDIIKPFFDQIRDFVSKDPVQLIQDSLKAIGIGALTALILPTATSLLSILLKNSYLMRAIDDAVLRRIPPTGSSGGRGGPTPVPVPGGQGGGNQTPRGPQNQQRAPYGAGAARAKNAAAAAAAAAEARTGWNLARAIGGRAVSALLGPVGWMLAMGLTAYQILDSLKKEKISEKDIKEALAYHGESPELQRAEYLGAMAPSTPSEQELKTFTKMSGSGGEEDAMRNAAAALNRTSDPDLKNELYKDVEAVKKVVEYRRSLKALQDQTNIEDAMDAAPFVKSAFAERWSALNKYEKDFVIQHHTPLFRTAKYVYFAGENGKIMKMTYVEYEKLTNVNDPSIVKSTRSDIESSLKTLIQSRESPPLRGEESSYDVVFGYGQFAKPPKPLTEMTGAEVQKFQEELVAKTRKAGIAGGEGTGAVGAYQATQGTLKDFYEKNPQISKDRLFDKEVQDAFFKWRINKDLNDYMSGKITKDQFADKVTGIWEVFGKNQKYKDELMAIIDSPLEGPKVANLSEEQKELKRKIDIERFKSAYEEFTSPIGNTTPLVINGVDVVGKATEDVKKVAERVKYTLSDIFNPNTKVTANTFFNDYENMVKDLEESLNNKQQVSVVYQDNSVSTSVAGGGGAAPSISVGSVSNRAYDKSWQFNSLAGGTLMG